ncbi:MAG: tetratricopeptide repeat protein [Deltaproteobacteria bacterium]|nr:tetratricopeptide repeat protein [Deltaproteobacteria bacterium]
MKLARSSLCFLVLITSTLILGLTFCYGQMDRGEIAPPFSLRNIEGKTYNLSDMKKHPMVILYFFDARSRPSQEGLLSLDQLAKQYKDADLSVWGITLSPKEDVASFLSKSNLSFHVLLDESDVSDLYQARMITPTVCILGPGLIVLDYFQGGGKTTEIMLVRLAERKLQQKQTVLAKAISDKVTEINPDNAEAKSLKGYASLEEGNLDEAEKTFHDLTKNRGTAKVIGKEGLAAIYAKRGETTKVQKIAKEIEEEAPDRAFIHVIKGNILAGQDKKEEARAEYQKGVEKKEALSFQKAVAYNQLGRLHSGAQKYDRARELYDQAIEIDPYYIEATSNKGVTYEKEGRWNDALTAYRKVLNLDRNDTFATVLARKAEEMLTFQKDVAQKKRIDKLVKELASRYHSQKSSNKKSEDAWTSRPMVLSFVDFQEKGGLAQRDGLSTVLTTQLADKLNASGRVKVVERVLVERLLEELNLGSSDLADPETALKLGKVLAAKLIGTGSLFYLPNGTLLSMRLIDTETSAIPKVVTKQLALGVSLEKELNELNRSLLKSIMAKYPLKGYVVRVSGDEAMINLGIKQGIVLGTRFEVIEEQEPIKYKGKLLHSAPKSIAQIEIIRVEPDLSYARILNSKRTIRPDDKVKEKLLDLIASITLMDS